MPGIRLNRLLTASAAAMLLPMGLASAQMMAPDGSEIVGQPLRVEVNGVTNTVYLNADGSARIVGSANQQVTGSWSAANGNLCLTGGSERECWPYQTAFQQGQPVVLTSDCGSASRFTALATNRRAPVTPPVQVQQAGERG